MKRHIEIPKLTGKGVGQIHTALTLAEASAKNRDFREAMDWVFAVCNHWPENAEAFDLSMIYKPNASPIDLPLKIVDYKMVRFTDDSSLVARMLSEGWELYEAPFADGGFQYQAMVKWA